MGVRDVLTLAPVPTWRDFGRAMRQRPRAGAELVTPWHRAGEVAGLLSRSAWSLALVAVWRGRQASGAVTVWVPDFFCNSSLAPLRATGARLVFYPVNEQMAPDVAALGPLAAEASPHVVLLVHYFGRPSPAPAVREFCARHGAWLVEDAAHVLRPVEGVGMHGDFVLYSPHKHLPMPDGAVLVARPGGPGQLGDAGLDALGPPAAWPGELASLAAKLPAGVSGAAASGIWTAKRLLQATGFSRRRLPSTPFDESVPPAGMSSAALAPPPASDLARRLLGTYSPRLSSIARWRQRHQLLWDETVAHKAAGVQEIVPAERPDGRAWTPYLAGYRLDSGGAARIFERWLAEGVPVTTWPDLPPEVSADRGRHVTAWHLRHSRFYLPVHQSLAQRAVAVRGRSSPSDPPPDAALRLVWGEASSDEWHRQLARAGRSNLLQSWAYGQAKSEQEGWTARRGVWRRGGEPIAMVQALQKRVALSVRVTRINRGPIMLPAALPGDARRVWHDLAHLGCWWRGSLLSAAPELELSGSASLDLIELGFRQFSPHAWESIWVDLRTEVATLRQTLDRKWRNMLSAAEKAGLTLDIGTDDQSFAWMMDRYQELVADKGFDGMSVGFIDTWRRHTEERNRPLVLRALDKGEPIAGVCIARHGVAATYLIGWNSQAGRQLKANQFLLWQAVTHLKGLGCEWLDLGGINEDHTPGIAAFKLGLNGTRYELGGEFWKW